MCRLTEMKPDIFHKVSLARSEQWQGAQIFIGKRCEVWLTYSAKYYEQGVNSVIGKECGLSLNCSRVVIGKEPKVEDHTCCDCCPNRVHDLVRHVQARPSLGKLDPSRERLHDRG
jgi:hypothetical protein